MKKVQQKTSYGCGLYAVQNALLLEGFVTKKRIQESKKGNGVHQLNKWLHEHGCIWRVSTVYFDMDNFKASNIKYWNNWPELSEDPIIALLQVKQSETSRWHMISCFVFKDKSVKIIDSLKTETINCRWDEINNHYYQVSGVFIFEQDDDQHTYAVRLLEKNHDQQHQNSSL